MKTSQNQSQGILTNGMPFNNTGTSAGGFVTLTSSGRSANYYNASDVLKTIQNY